MLHIQKTDKDIRLLTDDQYKKLQQFKLEPHEKCEHCDEDPCIQCLQEQKESMVNLSDDEFEKIKLVIIPQKRLNDIDDVLSIQCADGNWNYDEYMHGMANGMILVDSIVKNYEPEFLEAPKKWLYQEKSQLL
jgi:hypothetical protein